MNRRAKLTLSSGKDVDKKPAPDFDDAMSDSSVASPKATDEQPGISAAQSSGLKEDEAVLEMPAWRDRKQVVKVVLIVAATALSLYLLKRRFF